VEPERLYATNGVQVLPLNTIYQFFAARDTAVMRTASRALLIPDLVGYWLTGNQVSELTNASTTGLLDVRSRTWAQKLFAELSLRDDLFPAVVEPGHLLGPLVPELAADLGSGAVVTAVGSHDTASAVAGVPAREENFAYLSCGTWSLVGLELDEPMTSEPARTVNFTNELGVDGTVRFLRNVMGLWLLQESMRTWERGGNGVDLAALLARAADLPANRSLIDPDQPQFLPPGDMPTRIAEECRRTGQPVPTSPAEFTRCILDSLAAAYRRALDDARAITGRSVEVLHLVGGGARNRLLCQLTADACGLPVVAGPVEAAAYGNVLVQARAVGVINGSLPELRKLIPATHTVTYRPRT
jgi:rhamnulokinase